MFKKAISFLLVATLLLSSSFSVFAAQLSTYVYTESPSSVEQTSFYASAYISFADGKTSSDYDSFYFEYATDSSFNNSSRVSVSLDSSNRFSGRITDLLPNTTYYVRALITSYGFGEQIKSDSYAQVTTLVRLGEPKVETDSVTIKDGAIYATGTVDNSTYVFKKGFVYSATTKEPTTSDTVIEATTSSNNFSASFTPSLTENIYYVRAYVISDLDNRQTTTYGRYISINVGDLSPILKTVEVKNITSSTADVTIDIDKNAKVKIYERGVIYSESSKTPKINDKDSLYVAVSGTLGTVTETIKSLKPLTKYYVGAYIKTDTTVLYSETLVFKTLEQITTVNVSFRTPDGSVLSVQEIKSKPNDILITASLKIPTGYVLEASTWGYKVIEGKNDITVNIIRKVIEPVKPTETLVMSGVGNYMFYPEVNATRGEVAQIVYNLAVDKTYDSSKVKTFTDVPDGYSTVGTSKAAIDFVTAKGYMNGLGTSKFEPNTQLTRAQLATVLVQYYELTISNDAYFPDVAKLDTATNEFWGKKFVYTVASKGFMNGKSKTEFGPNDPLKRSELAQSFYNAEKIVNNRSDQPLSSQTYIDVPANYWAYRVIQNMSIPN